MNHLLKDIDAMIIQLVVLLTSDIDVIRERPFSLERVWLNLHFDVDIDGRRAYNLLHYMQQTTD